MRRGNVVLDRELEHQTPLQLHQWIMRRLRQVAHRQIVDFHHRRGRYCADQLGARVRLDLVALADPC